jgi:hypothetical protein
LRLISTKTLKVSGFANTLSEVFGGLKVIEESWGGQAEEDWGDDEEWSEEEGADEEEW